MEIDALTCRIGGTTILDELTAECPDGGITVLIGPNGAGKTTLLRCLWGDLPAVPARITLGGRTVDPASVDWKREVGVVPDSDALFAELTVGEQLALAGTLFGIRGDRQKERVDSLIEAFGLSDHRDALGKELSAGLRKRLAIALSLVHAPRLILLDEPLNSLDYAGGETLFALLRFLRSVGRTVVVSSHSIAALLLVADRVLEIDHGRIVNSVDVDGNDRSVDTLLGQLRTLHAPPQRTGPTELVLPWLAG